MSKRNGILPLVKQVPTDSLSSSVDFLQLRTIFQLLTGDTNLRFSSHGKRKRQLMMFAGTAYTNLTFRVVSLLVVPNCVSSGFVVKRSLV